MYDDATQDQYLELCLSISGFFESSSYTLKWDNLSGDFDGQGMSVGELQYNPGQGSLQILLKKCIEYMGPEKANSYFSAYGPSVITNLSVMNTAQGKNYCVANFIDQAGKGRPLLAKAKQTWAAFLLDADVIRVQKYLAKNSILAKAFNLAQQFVPWDPSNNRVVAFFFDIVVQSGGMSNSRGSVSPIAKGTATDHNLAIQMAHDNKFTKTGDAWQKIVDEDDLAKTLLHYAYQRAKLSLPQWQWNTLARRGSIACRCGTVDGAWMDFTSKLS